MITFNYETNFALANETKVISWIKEVVLGESFKVGDLNYIFCTDEDLHKINVEFLQHDNYTDIISFDYTVGKILNGDIYISVDRVKENAEFYKTSFLNEMYRVMIHGVLHYMGYKDKTKQDKESMRWAEDKMLTLIKG